jgi:hypothetical protein
MKTVLAAALFLLPFSTGLAQAADTAYLDQLVQRAQAEHVATSREWLKLLHYEKGLFGGYESQVDGRDFFLSPDGKADPEKELIATLQGFFADHPVDRPAAQNEKGDDRYPFCLFPARWQLLKSKLAIDPAKLPRRECPGFNEFKGKLSAESATLIFSSFYLNNPSSAFGHSFMRINSSKSHGPHGERNELLDHGVNYAAEVTTTNPILYAVFGLAGLFRGTFTSVPYYYKVREYNDYEARDLWGYDLNLKPAELEMLVAHVWELGHTYYDYFYFTENCSYHMFTTVEAAAPRLRLTEKLPFYVIPSDTTRALRREPGLVAHVSYRPSVRTQFQHRLKSLSDEEQDVLAGLVLDQDLSVLKPDLPKKSQARILDAALDYMEFKHPEDLRSEKTPSSQWKQKLLIARASLGIRSESLEISPPRSEMPHLGHGIRRLTLGGGALGQSLDSPAYATLGMRFALNDMLDPGPGYPRNAQIEFMNVNLRYGLKPSRLQLEDLTLFRVTSLSPFTRFNHDVSFRVDLGMDRLVDRNCPDCLAGSFEAGPGIALQPTGSDRFTLFGFADAQIAFSPKLPASNVRLGLGPRAGAVFLITEDFRATVSGNYHYLAFSREPSSYEADAELRYGLSSTLAFNLQAARWMNVWKTGAALMVYF